MKNLKKKGFTIVELVIVIAVIAILSAVLIPTFSNLIKKANTSADIQAVRQMNTQLAVNEVTEGKSIIEVYEVLSNAGMTAKDYTPLSSDTYFFWDRTENRVLYTDKNYAVIYPEEYKDATKANGWYSLSGKIDESSATIELDDDDIASGSVNSYSVSNAADLVKLSEFVIKNKETFATTNTTLEIILGSSIDLMGADVSFGQLHNLNVTLDGQGNELKGLYVSDKHYSMGHTSEGELSKYGSGLFTDIKSLNVKNIAVKDSVTGSTDLKQCAIFATQVNGTVAFENVTVENCIVSGLNKSGILAGYIHDKVTLKNVTLKNNKVIAGEGECGVLFGVAVYVNRDTDTHFSVENLVMENNTVSFAEDTVTFKLTAAKVADYIAEKGLPVNSEFAYETDSDHAARVGLANLCFVGNDNSGKVTHHNKVTIDDIQIRIMPAVNNVEDLNDTSLIVPIA